MFPINRFSGFILTRWVCGILCLLLFRFSVSAQTKPTLLFKHLTLEDGLSDPTVQALHVDRDGFLWMGTENGLNRFDGKTCITYKKNNLTTTFPGNYITNIIEDKNGNLIIGSQSNLVKYSRKQDGFIPYNLKRDLN